MRYPLLFIFLLAALLCRADDEVSATAQYVCSKELSVARAEQIAIQRAREKAIADTYGIAIQQLDGVDLRNGNLSFASQSTHLFKGIWIKDTRAPECHTQIYDDMLTVEARVWGITRQLEHSGPEFSAALLRNHTDAGAWTTEFNDGDRLYLSFRAAVDGYLAVFTRDDSVRLLLPHISASDGLLPIKANQRYVFFDEPGQKIIAQTDQEVDATTIYVLFSPQKILRPIAHRTDEGGLPLYSVDEFFAILNKRQTADRQMQVKPINVLIRNFKNSDL